jgi:hypothetical protein
MVQDLGREVFWGGSGDLGYIVEVEGGTEIYKLYAFDVGFVCVHLH